MKAGSSSKKFKVFDTVNTVYGAGYIQEVRSSDYVVRLVAWQLAQGQSPTLYLQEEALHPIPGVFPGVCVKTVYGPARMEKIRADNIHIAKPINWKLANATSATLFLQPEAVELIHTPGFEEGDEVMTVYGQGFIESKRANDYVVKLRNWALAQGQSPTCYLAKESLVKIPGLEVGKVAKTVWGLVRVLDIKRDGQHVCEAIHWSLANGEKPTLYLAPEAFALLSIKP